MEFRQLRSFEAVARTMSFTAAARELHFVQSTVSEQIQNLERELGVPLFDRSNRQLELTARGAALRDYATRILALAGEAQRAMSEPAGESRLTIGALETLAASVLPRALAGFRALHPEVPVSVRQANRGELYDAVRSGSMDVCVTFGPAPDRFGLTDATLAREPLVVVVPADHSLRGRSSAPIGRLLDETFLVTAPGCGFRDMYDRTIATLSSVARASETKAVLEVESVDAVIACVAGGLGCALLPELAVADAVRRGDVSTLPIADLDLGVPITVTRRTDTPPLPHVDAFCCLLRAEYRSVRLTG